MGVSALEEGDTAVSSMYVVVVVVVVLTTHGEREQFSPPSALAVPFWSAGLFPSAKRDRAKAVPRAPAASPGPGPTPARNGCRSAWRGSAGRACTAAPRCAAPQHRAGQG